MQFVVNTGRARGKTRRSARRWLSLAWLLAILGTALPAHADEWSAALRRFERAPALRGARIGVLVTDLESGEVLLDKGASTPMVPASSQKLLVASAALERWGPAHRFETPVLVEGSVDAKGVLAGRLWIVGRGDPSFVSESLWRLAEEIRLRGIREVQGGLGIDATHFDRVHVHPDWEPVSTRAYHARISAWAANYSSFRVEVAPGARAEGPVSVAIAPATQYFRVDSRATTVSRGGRLTLDQGALPDGSGERVAVAGSLRRSSESRTFWRSVASPELYAASVLRMQLEAQGIRVGSATLVGAAPADARELLRFQGEPLALMLRSLNKYSNNFIAEQLTKAMGAEREGAPGTWAKGTAVVREHLDAIGALVPGAVIADGSGLSPRNRVSPSMLVGVIRHELRRSAWSPEFLASLPLSGRDGTLEDRFVEATSVVRGKTGHLNGVASLAGVVAAPGSRALAFAVIINGARGDAQGVDRAIDGLVGAFRAAAPDAAPSQAEAPPGGAPRAREDSTRRMPAGDGPVDGEPEEGGEEASDEASGEAEPQGEDPGPLDDGSAPLDDSGDGAGSPEP